MVLWWSVTDTDVPSGFQLVFTLPFCRPQSSSISLALLNNSSPKFTIRHLIAHPCWQQFHRGNNFPLTSFTRSCSLRALLQPLDMLGFSGTKPQIVHLHQCFKENVVWHISLILQPFFCTFIASSPSTIVSDLIPLISPLLKHSQELYLPA